MVRTSKSRRKKSKAFTAFKEFTFIGNTALETPENSSEQLSLHPNSNYLINTDPGKSFFVTQVYGAKNIVRQLRSLNFKPGEKVELISKTANGSVVVSLNNQLIGMGTEVAQNIVVTLAN